MDNTPWHISLGRGPVGPKRRKIISSRPWLLQTTLPLKITLLSIYLVFLVIVVPYCRGQEHGGHSHNHNGDRHAFSRNFIPDLNNLPILSVDFFSTFIELFAGENWDQLGYFDSLPSSLRWAFFLLCTLPIAKILSVKNARAWVSKQHCRFGQFGPILR